MHTHPQLQIELDRNLCICAENCVHTAPRTFATDDTFRVVLLAAPHDDEATVIEAAASCPVGALQVRRLPSTHPSDGDPE